MRRWFRLLVAIGSATGLMGAALLLVSQTRTTTASALISSVQPTHYAWGLVVDDGFGNPLNQMLNALQEFNGQTVCRHDESAWRRDLAIQ